jgi:Tfp pilus assembly protein PilP
MRYKLVKIKKYIIPSVTAFSLSFSAIAQEEIEIFDEDDSGEEQINFIDDEPEELDAVEDNIVVEGESEAMEPATENLTIDGENDFVEDPGGIIVDQVGEDISAEIVEEAEEISDEEMIADYAEGDIADNVTEGIRIEDIVQPQNEFHFSSFGKADPFVPPVTLDDITKQGEDIIEVELKSVLQKHPLLALKVAGVWQVGTIRKALVTTPTNEGVVVEEGDPMGLRGGKVISVQDDHVVVREFDLVADGTRQFEDIKVYLFGRKPKNNGKIVFKPGAEPQFIPPQGGEGLLEVVPVNDNAAALGQGDVLGDQGAGDEVEVVPGEMLNNQQ